MITSIFPSVMIHVILELNFMEKQFIRKNKPILLLVWFGKLDEADVLDYFHGYTEWEELISCI